jgi:hypothetical protein
MGYPNYDVLSLLPLPQLQCEMQQALQWTLTTRQKRADEVEFRRKQHKMVITYLVKDIKWIRYLTVEAQRLVKGNAPQISFPDISCRALPEYESKVVK